MSKGTEIEKISRFKLMEAADDLQIIAEINGEMAKAFVYRVKGKDKLSYSGAKFAAQKLGDIHVKDHPVITYNEVLDQFEATALAFNEESKITLPGFAEQPRLMKVWDNKEKTESHLELDEFARRKAGAKAVRNALMAVMPADHIAAYMRAMIDQGKTRVIRNKPKQVEAEAVVKPPPPISVSVDSIHYRLSENIIGLDDILTISDYEDFVRIGKNRNLDDEEYTEINGRIERLGGSWSKEDNCWKIPKEQG